MNNALTSARDVGLRPFKHSNSFPELDWLTKSSTSLYILSIMVMCEPPNLKMETYSSTLSWIMVLSLSILCKKKLVRSQPAKLSELILVHGVKQVDCSSN